MTIREFSELLKIMEKEPLTHSERFEKILMGLRTFVSDSLGVEEYEISLFIVDKSGFAHFALPKSMQKSGFPLRKSKVTKKVFDTGAPVVTNEAAGVERYSIYEQMKDTPDKVMPIQKFMAVPLKDAEKTFGVIWINRRAETFEKAGPGFTSADLGKALTIAETVAPYLSRLRPESMK
ncbi:MAG: GAF domain-containing protein [Acidobacteriota bacterium]